MLCSKRYRLSTDSVHWWTGFGPFSIYNLYSLYHIYDVTRLIDWQAFRTVFENISLHGKMKTIQFYTWSRNRCDSLIQPSLSGTWLGSDTAREPSQPKIVCKSVEDLDLISQPQSSPGGDQPPKCYLPRNSSTTDLDRSMLWQYNDLEVPQQCCHSYACLDHGGFLCSHARVYQRACVVVFHQILLYYNLDQGVTCS